MGGIYTADLQVRELIKNGMIISNRENALYFIISCHYEHVINVIGSFFRQPDSDQFYEGTSINEIKSIYHFDVEVKQAIYRAMTHAEGHLRSVIAYYFNAAHPEVGSYLDSSNFRDLNADERKFLENRFKQLLGNVNSDKRNYPIREEYLEKGFIPLDKLINYFDFAMLRVFFSCMKPEDKTNIWFFFTKYMMDEYQISVRINDQDIDLIMGNLCELRNLIAHNNQLFNFHCKNQPPYLTQLSYLPGTSPEGTRTDVYNTLLLLQPFIEYSQFATLYNGIHKRANQLSKKLKSINVNKIMSTLGFFDDWHLTPRLLQTKQKIQE